MHPSSSDRFPPGFPLPRCQCAGQSSSPPCRVWTAGAKRLLDRVEPQYERTTLCARDGVGDNRVESATDRLRSSAVAYAAENGEVRASRSSVKFTATPGSKHGSKRDGVDYSRHFHSAAGSTSATAVNFSPHS